MNKMLKKEPLTIFGKGDMVRDYIYIQDLISMVVGSYAKNNKFNEYNLSSCQGRSVKQVIEAIEACAGYKAKKKYAPVPPTFTHKSILDNSRFVNEFNINVSTPLEQGLEITWKHINAIE
jgi:UDP-glucose 4-epimerase